MSEIRISVIMPVYKVERYVARAIESIQNQTLREFEFLIVDDGSPDKSGEICDRYAAKDARIRVLHRKNGGAPAARNAAMDLARGKYLYFMDSDDWAEPEMLEEMYRLAERHEAQLVVAGFYIDTYYAPEKYTTDVFAPEHPAVFSRREGGVLRETGDGRNIRQEKQGVLRETEDRRNIRQEEQGVLREAEDRRNIRQEEQGVLRETEDRRKARQEDRSVFLNQEAFREVSCHLFDRNLLYTPWNKLYLREYIEQHRLRFPKTMWDDFPFNLSVVEKVERVVVTERPYYHFIRERAESETAAYRPQMYEKREEEHGWLLALYEKWQVHTPETEEFLARRYIERWIGCLENLTNPKSGLSYREKRQAVKKMLGNERTAKSLRTAKPRSVYMKLLLVPAKWKNVTLLLLEAQAITWVKTKNTKLFAKLKAGR